MSTYTQILYQIVFSTRSHENTLAMKELEKLYHYIFGILKNKKCFLYKIGGVENHIHVIMSLHPTVALSGLMKDIKLATSDWIKRERIFPYFNGWQDGYGAFTYSIDAKERLIGWLCGYHRFHRRSFIVQPPGVDWMFVWVPPVSPAVIHYSIPSGLGIMKMI